MSLKGSHWKKNSATGCPSPPQDICAVSRRLLGGRTGGLGDDVSAKLHGDTAEGGAVGGNVKVNLGVTAQ